MCFLSSCRTSFPVTQTLLHGRCILSRASSVVAHLAPVGTRFVDPVLLWITFGEVGAALADFVCQAGTDVVVPAAVAFFCQIFLSFALNSGASSIMASFPAPV